MKICTWISGLAAMILTSTPALPWGYEGHEMVGAIADQMLTAHAKQQVQQILGFTLQVAAPWPDCVRSVVREPDGSTLYAPDPHHPEYRTPCHGFEADHGAAAEQARMEDYAKRNWTNCVYVPGRPCHEGFHFTDVAIQRDDYKPTYVGTNTHDVVHAINACIAVLQGHPAPAPFSIKDKKEALFLLAHFVGDIHQPLHVGAVYLDANGKLVDPDKTTFDPKTETHGGNSIKDGKEHLHSEWDGIPDAWGLTPDAAMLADARTVPTTPEPVTGWAQAWATDTLLKAHDAFQGLTFSAAEHHLWNVHFADKHAYKQNAEKIKRSQLAKGGARLAQLLNSIWP
jgi:S1/P1 Nuclease